MSDTDKWNDFIEGTRRAEGEYDQNTDLSRCLRNFRPSSARATSRAEFVERMQAETRAGKVRAYIPEVGES